MKPGRLGYRCIFSSHKFICLISYQHYSLSCGREEGKQGDEPENKIKSIFTLNPVVVSFPQTRKENMSDGIKM